MMKLIEANIECAKKLKNKQKQKKFFLSKQFFLILIEGV